MIYRSDMIVESLKINRQSNTGTVEYDMQYIDESVLEDIMKKFSDFISLAAEKIAPSLYSYLKSKMDNFDMKESKFNSLLSSATEKADIKSMFSEIKKEIRKLGWKKGLVLGFGMVLVTVLLPVVFGGAGVSQAMVVALSIKDVYNGIISFVLGNTVLDTILYLVFKDYYKDEDAQNEPKPKVEVPLPEMVSLA